MTTFEPGARVVFTHGLRDRPRSTAFLASSAAPIITDGLDVLVHDVIAAIATAPWSSVNDVPSDKVTSTGLLVDPSASAASIGCPLLTPNTEGGSDAGKLSSIDSSTAERSDD